jgi:hypothetical protein
MNKKNLYLKILLTLICALLALNLMMELGIFHNDAYAVTQTSEFQDRFKFLLGKKSNITGNLMVIEYPGKGIYYINLDQVGSLFEGENYLEFKADGSRFKVPKPDLSNIQDTDDNEDNGENESTENED